MKIIRSILGRIFAVYAMLWFVITMIPTLLIIWITGLLKEPARSRVFRKITKVWMNFYFLLIGCRLKVTGLNNFEKGRNYIVICNHSSLMDVPLSTPEIPGANRTIAKSEMAKIPLFGMIYKRGSVLVDRKDKDSRRESFSKMKEVLDKGMHMCIYPEGTRNKTDQPLKEFHDGAFRLASDTGKPILPGVIFGTNDVLPSDKKFFFWPGTMRFEFLSPREVTRGEDIELLKQEMHKRIRDHYVANS